MTIQADLFNETRVHIPGNPMLEGIANHILELVNRDTTLLDGDKVGEIDRRLTLAIWYESGLKDYIAEDLRESFARWFANCPDPEAIARARRWLMERDHIRLSASAIKNAEIQKLRIQNSVRG